MTLSIIVKAQKGLALATESRVTHTTTEQTAANTQVSRITFDDNSEKLLTFYPPHNFVGVLTHGRAKIGERTAYEYLTELEEQLPEKRVSVFEFAKNLSNFFMKQWNTTIGSDYKGDSIEFLIAGFNENEEYGRIYEVKIPDNSDPFEVCEDFDMLLRGQKEIVHRIRYGYDYHLPKIVTDALKLSEEQKEKLSKALKSLWGYFPDLLASLSMDNLIDLCTFLIQISINAQKFMDPRYQGCGGPIKICTITKQNGTECEQRRQVRTPFYRSYPRKKLKKEIKKDYEIPDSMRIDFINCNIRGIFGTPFNRVYDVDWQEWKHRVNQDDTLLHTAFACIRVNWSQLNSEREVALIFYVIEENRHYVYGGENLQALLGITKEDLFAAIGDNCESMQFTLRLDEHGITTEGFIDAIGYDPTNGGWYDVYDNGTYPINNTIYQALKEKEDLVLQMINEQRMNTIKSAMKKSLKGRHQ